MSSFTVPYGVTSTALFIRVKAEANGEYDEGWGLIDTGSVDSGITETVVNKLNVVPIKGKEYHGNPDLADLVRFCPLLPYKSDTSSS